MSDVPFASEQGGAVGGGYFAMNGGYLDSALPFSHFRLRFDAAYGNNRPDRAEYFYAKCGCFGTPDAQGPPFPERNVDYQDISAYLEIAASDRFSVFLETPVRFINPVVNDNSAGFADMNLGFKYALIADPSRYLTFQLRGYMPTGDSDRGLGTHHVSLEPGLLFLQNPTDRLLLQAELRDWIPIGGSDFAGNILRYGVGASYEVFNNGNARIAPVAELVGWTVLGGNEFNGIGPVSAAGDTIINAKFGLRMGLGDLSNFYIGYGRALTGEVWYKDILRLEYRLAF